MSKFKGNGGYEIIRLENIDATDGVTIEGIYDRIEGATKPIYCAALSSVVSGTVIEGKPMFLQFALDGSSNFVAQIQSVPTISGNAVTKQTIAWVIIDDDDLVKVTSAEFDVAE